MTAEWTVTADLVTFLKEIMAEPRVTELTDQMPVFYPTIMWSLGGTLHKRGKPTRHTPPGYGLGISESTTAGKLIPIPSAVFGTILFQPSEDDAASSRRMLDYDGTDIVVR